MNKKFGVTIIIGIVAILGISSYFFLTRKQNLFIHSGESECKRISGSWVQCFNYGPCCSKQFSDGGKQCSSGSDCLSGICKIGTANLINPPPVENKDSYIGTCRESFIGDPYNISEPESGEASLQNGKIIKDRRNESGVIY